MSSIDGPHQRGGASGGSGRADPPPPNVEDVEMLRRLRSGDRGALERVYEAYSEELYRLAVALTGSPSEAEDVVQEVFLGVPEALKRFEGRSSLWTWLRTITVRCVLMRRRAERRFRDFTRSLIVVFREPEVERAQLERISLERALGGLPEGYRDVLVLKYVEELTHEEIAGTLGISRRASENRLYRARGMLGDALAGEYP